MVTEDLDVNPALVPMVAIDAERYGDSLLDAAVVILTMAQYWRVIGSVIEDRRCRPRTASPRQHTGRDR
ncbi:hypothetical protein U8Q05_34220 (plasmid) [Rhizobium ruizarguesonis]|nr:hypothetical protein U8Q05_34220 [Rhizobium ruizarguesonis]